MKCLFCRAVLVLLISMAGYAQKLLIETDTAEGQLLQQIDAEANQAKKLAMLEQFAKTFPNHEAMNWVLSNLQSAYVGQKNYDRAMEAGLRLLSLDPNDVVAAHNCLKAMEGRNDVEMIRKWSELTSQIARKVRQSKKPDDADDVEEWKQKIEYAKEVERYTEYALYYAALQSKDGKVKNKLIEALEQKNPTSEYLAQLRTSQTQVVRQVDVEEAVAAAEIGFKKNEVNEEQLLMVATHYMSRRLYPDRVIAYSNKLIEVLESKPKPADLSDADWNRKRNNMLGTAYWMVGLLYSTQERFAQADKNLRRALPLLRNSDMIAGALYHLGYVNYRLAEAGERIRIHDAVRFTNECIAINSAVQGQAVENLKSMKAEYSLP